LLVSLQSEIQDKNDRIKMLTSGNLQIRLELSDLKIDYLETKRQLKEAPIIYLDHTAISRISALEPTLASLASSKLGPTFAMSKDGCLVFAKVSDSEKEPLLEAAMASPASTTTQFKCNNCKCLTACYLATDLFCISPEALHTPNLSPPTLRPQLAPLGQGLGGS
ncbi:hypothetical protein L0F63_003356, partial [Massospora cicadina]